MFSIFKKTKTRKQQTVILICSDVLCYYLSSKFKNRISLLMKQCLFLKYTHKNRQYNIKIGSV
uniref:Uncharacterized protein n=1 Tax=Schistosoma haematobium TaxID=6185 RepID=A0A095BUI5_SCHHA